MPQEIYESAFVEPALYTMTSQEEIFLQRVKEDVKRTMTKDNQSTSLPLRGLVSEIPKPFWLKGMEHRHKARKYKGEDMCPRTMTSNAMQSFEHQICLYGKLRHNWGIILPPKSTPAMTLIIPKRILISRLTCELKWAGEHCQSRREKNHLLPRLASGTSVTSYVCFGSCPNVQVSLIPSNTAYNVCGHKLRMLISNIQ